MSHLTIFTESKVIIMLEPSHDSVIRDHDGYRWKWDESNSGWTLRNFEHVLAYVGLQWPVLVRDYGPLKLER